MITEAPTPNPFHLHPNPPSSIQDKEAVNTGIVFEEDSDVERLVDEVLQLDNDPSNSSINLSVPLLNNTEVSLEEAMVVSSSYDEEEEVYNSPDNGQTVADEVMGNDDEEEYYVDPFDLLQTMGVKAFIEEQRNFEADPKEIFEAFELDCPLIDDQQSLWEMLEAALEEVYIGLLMSESSSSYESGDDDMAVELECDNLSSADGHESSVETPPPEEAERLALANAYLVELREKGPLAFADHHEALGTSAVTFLHALGFRLPKSMVYLDHHSQWSFIKRFLIRHVYQRPRNESLTSFEHAVECIRRAERILIVTGAGISVSCGIPDFRSENGLYKGIRERFALPEPECMFDIEYFRDDPAPFFMLAKELFPGRFKPSLSHYFIRELETNGKLLRNFTQNIDTLEQVAGIERAVYCHGSFATATCIQCKAKCTVDQLKAMMDANPSTGIPYCVECEDGVVKPDIVFFGEPLPSEFDTAIEADVGVADLVIVIGSSMKVQPVSMIPDLICPSVPQILINRERLDHHFDIELIGDADTILAELASSLGIQVLGPYNISPAEEAVKEFVEPNVTLFSGCSIGDRPAIPDPDLLDGSLMTQALSPVQQDPRIESLVQQIFPKPL